MSPTRAAVYKRTVRAERIARGVCVECGAQPPGNGQRCVACALLNNDRVARARSRAAAALDATREAWL